MIRAAEAFPYEIPRAGIDVGPMLDVLGQPPEFLVRRDTDYPLLSDVPDVDEQTYYQDPPAHETMHRERLRLVPTPATFDEAKAEAELFVDKMRAVGATLPAAGIQDTFNYVYWRLSKYCMHSVKQDNNSKEFSFPEFEMPTKVMHMMAVFGEKYLGQLRSYGQWVEGDDDKLNDLNMPWLLSFFHPAIRNGNSDCLKFLVGMMTHIKYDLPISVYEGGIDEAYHSDFSAPVQTLIRRITRELSPALVPIPGPNALRRAMTAPIVGYIGMIREVAWDDAVNLEQAVLLDSQAHRNRELAESIGLAWPADTGLSNVDQCLDRLHHKASASIDRLLTVVGGPMEIGSRLVQATTALVTPGHPNWKTYDAAS